MNYGELQKLYPDFKIPYEKLADYYISLLIPYSERLQIQFHDFSDLKKEHPDCVRYKFQKFDEILAYFKTNNWDLNSIDKDASMLNAGYSTKEFGDYKPDKFYLSIDLKEANWQSFKYGLGLTHLPDFETWTCRTFDLHPAIARSKSFRQYIFGNTNPKRLQRIQESIMKMVYEGLEIWQQNVVSKKSDELLLEFDTLTSVDNFFNIFFLNLPFHRESKFEFKYTWFMVTEHQNFDEFVRIKEKYTNESYSQLQERQLMAVPGNRFFMHYKTLILKQELCEWDTLFVVDKKLATWI